MVSVRQIAKSVARLVRPRFRARTQNSRTKYESGWDRYSDTWESSVLRSGLHYLGDEWGSDQLTDEIIDQYVRPFLPMNAITVEIGCGGGKFSEKLVPLCRELICTDVSLRMLRRTEDRLKGAEKVRFEKLNGMDLHNFDSESIDYIFSFDCFVHIEIEDVYCYLQEIRRVLKPRGVGLLHFANLNTDEGWEKFVSEAPINRGNQKHFDRFCFLTWEIVEKFFTSLDLQILAHKREPWRDILVVFRR